MRPTKTCTKCKTEKDIEQFSKDKSKTDGLRSHCRACASELRRAHYQVPANKVRNRENAYRWHDNNTDKVRQMTVRYKQSEKGKEAARRRNDKRRVALHQAPGFFPVNGWAVLVSFYGARCMNSSCNSGGQPTLDHVVPLTLGGEHSLSNAQLLCHSCNSAKGNRRMTDYRDYSQPVLSGHYGARPLRLNEMNEWLGWKAG